MAIRDHHRRPELVPLVTAAAARRAARLAAPARGDLGASVTDLLGGAAELHAFGAVAAGLDQVDEIVVLDHGEVAERGTHDELVRSGGAYQRLWQASPGEDL